MRLFSVFAAYMTIGLVIALVLLFPNRPATVMGGMAVVVVLTLIVGLFDVLGQWVLDYPQFKQLPQFVRSLVFVVVIGLFFGTTYFGIEMLAPQVAPWIS